FVESCFFSCFLSRASFFFATPPPQFSTLSLDALPISLRRDLRRRSRRPWPDAAACRVDRRRPSRRAARQPHLSADGRGRPDRRRSEEHTSELQSHLNLVCRLLLEKKKQLTTHVTQTIH